MGLFKKSGPRGAGRGTIAEEKVRRLVFEATVTMEYSAVLRLHAIVAPSVPSGVDIWEFWVSEVEKMQASGDPDVSAYAQFARNAAYMEPFGDLPDGISDRLYALGAGGPGDKP